LYDASTNPTGKWLALGGGATSETWVAAVQNNLLYGDNIHPVGPHQKQYGTLIWDALSHVASFSTAASAEILNSIQTILGSGTAVIYSPVAGDGTLLELIIGDDYLTANGRALAWTFDEITGITISATGRFGIRDASTGLEVYQNTSGVVTEPTTGTFKVSFDIPKAALSSLPPGDYDWSVQVVEGSYCITVAKNRQRKTRVKLVEKYTTCS
jgi:hypothetical protein